MYRPQPSTDPDLPPAKSANSSLLAVFKSLTGTTKSKLIPPSPSTTATSYPSNASNGPRLLEKPVSSGLLSPTAPIPSPPITSGTQLRDASTHSSLSGGPDELGPLLKQLDDGNDRAVRAKAASQVAQLLKAYPVANVVDIWTTAKDLIEDKDSPETHVAGYNLLYACVKHKTLTPHERGFFFEAIPLHEDANTFGYRFKVIRALTDDARYLDALENMIIPLLVAILQQCYQRTAAARRSAKDNNEDNLNLQRGSNSQLKQVFDFIVDVIRFNAKLCTRDDLKTLVDELLTISRSTHDEDDIARSIQIVDSCITYSQLHPENLQAYVEVITHTYAKCSGVKEKAWSAMHHLLHSHHSPATHEALLGILKAPSHAESRAQYPPVECMRGAVQIYTRIITSSNSDDALPQTSISRLVSACKKALGIDSFRLEKDILALLLELVRTLDTTSLLLDDKRWTNFADTVESCAKRLPARDRPHQLQRPLSLRDGRQTLAAKETDVFGPKEREISFQRVQGIADYLIASSADMDFDHRIRVMSLFMRVVAQLNDSTATMLIEFYALEVLLSPSTTEWQAGCDQLLTAILYDGHRTSSVRSLALKTLQDAYNTGEALGNERVDNLMLAILKRIVEERNIAIVEELSTIAAGIASWTTSEKAFTEIVQSLRDALSHFNSTTPMATPTTAHSEVSSHSWSQYSMPETTSLHIARALVIIFLRSINRSAWKTEKIYEVILNVAASEQSPSDARIVCLKLLFRLRADTTHAIFVVSSTDCQELAEALCRTEKTVVSTPQDSSPSIRPAYSEDSVARRPMQSTASSSGTVSRITSAATRSYGSVGRINKPTPPLWLYPGPKGLPEEPQATASRLVYAYLDPKKTIGLSGARARVVLNLGAWLEFLLGSMQQPELDWEVYSYIVVHLGAQLTNHALFVDCVPQMKLLRGIVCQQLSNKNFHEPPFFTNLKKDDVALCLYYVLTMLLGYRDHYSKNEEDDMVKMFVLGIGSWERTADTCIHALSVCCHELPLSITKSVGDILQRMSQIITRGQAAVHILEFLASLARLPDLCHNFREEEFRMVFGICFNYLRFVRERDPKRSQLPSRQSSSQLRSLVTGRDSPSTPDHDKRGPSLADDLPQYVYTLAYHAMTFWFMSVKIQDRAKLVPFIRRNLAFADADGRETLEEPAQVLIDLMDRVAYTDLDETAADADFAAASDGPVIKKSWLVGMSILTIETASRTGVSQIVHRRPSSTKYSYHRPSLIKQPRHQIPAAVGSGSDAYYADDYAGILPEDVLQEFYSPQNVGSALAIAEPPVLIEDNDMTRRGISAFDRISPLDSHKAGIIYVGEGHTTETDILQNVMGSADYTAFLNKIGTLTELKGAKFNTQGLDRETDRDGKFTFAWRDRVSELVFHVTTMMPTNIENDPRCINKKSHIGNDFVNIVFNNSGEPFQFNTFPSDFNYVYIVITPEARASFVETRLSAADYVSTNSSGVGGAEAGQQKTDEDPWDHLFYKVTVLTRPDIASISPAAETKIVSGASLASFVRLLVLNASVFCNVWSSRELSTGEYISSWRSRLREIKKLRERHITADMAPPQAYQQQSYGSPMIPAKAAPLDRTLSSNALSQLNLGSNGNSQAQPVRELNGVFGVANRDTSRSTGESAIFRRPSAAHIFSLDGGHFSTPSTEAPTFNVNPNANRHSTLSRGSAATDMDRSSSQGSSR